MKQGRRGCPKQGALLQTGAEGTTWQKPRGPGEQEAAGQVWSDLVPRALAVFFFTVMRQAPTIVQAACILAVHPQAWASSPASASPVLVSQVCTPCLALAVALPTTQGDPMKTALDWSLSLRRSPRTWTLPSRS